MEDASASLPRTPSGNHFQPLFIFDENHFQWALTGRQTSKGTTGDEASPFYLQRIRGADLTKGIFTWVSVPNAEEYAARWKPGDSDEWETAEGIEANTYTATELTPQTQYEVQVRSLCGENGESAYSNSVVFFTMF